MNSGYFEGGSELVGDTQPVNQKATLSYVQQLNIKLYLNLLKIEEKLKDELFFSDILSIVMAGYINFTVSFVLFFKSPERDNEWLTWVMGFICYVLVPGLIFYIGSRDDQTLCNPEFKQRFKVLYSGLRRQTKLQLHY